MIGVLPIVLTWRGWVFWRISLFELAHIAIEKTGIMKMKTETLIRVLRRFKSWRSTLWGDGWSAYFGGHAHLSWSQLGEDVMLRPFLVNRLEDVHYKGFWVDIGCNHPVRYSNTKMFSDNGWTGINVDAMPESIERFKRVRPQDINVNIGIGEKSGTMDYYVFESDCYNTFSKSFADKVISSGEKLREVRKVPVVTLETLLDKYLPVGRNKIDFMTIDTEGIDLEILKSNIWNKYSPDFILIEIHTDGSNSKILNGPVAKFLMGHHYEYAGQCAVTTLFRKVAN